MSGTRRVVIDGHFIDAVLEHPEWLPVLQGAIEGRRLQLLVTHVQLDEFNDMPPDQPDKAEKHGYLVQLLHDLAVERVATYGYVLGTSRLGEAQPNEGPGGPYATNPKNIEDHLMVDTAARLGLEFCSYDKGARAYAKGKGVPCLTPAELVASLTT